ncbi:MAG: LLM class flavin-dependent oxidoreductase [Campylobacterales bacterium]|nr:LLM class flavin-dependent oxidoreductase [Campylobacterales bacterium]
MKLGIFLLTENFGENAHDAILNDIELAIYAEKLRFNEVWFAEHHFNSFSVIPNPALMMATLAARTDKIRIGTAAFLAPFYNPIRLAKEIVLPATDPFVKSMRAVKAKGVQANFNEENYEELLAQRYAFFDAKTFMEALLSVA